MYVASRVIVQGMINLQILGHVEYCKDQSTLSHGSRIEDTYRICGRVSFLWISKRGREVFSISSIGGEILLWRHFVETKF